MPDGNPAQCLSPQHKAARRYAEAGVPVFACVANGKEPIAGSHGFKDATTDLATIDRWWSSNPALNIAVEPERLGAAVIDIDPKNGGDASAFDPTFTINTPSGGKHLWYRGSLPPSVQKIAPGVDVRGRGGYVLVPPSVVNGKPYIGSFPPDDWEMTELPQTIAEKLNRKRDPLPAPKGFREDTARAIAAAYEEVRRWITAGRLPIAGGRNVTIATLAAKLHGIGVSEITAVELLEDYVTAPGAQAPDEAIDYIVASAYRSAQNPAGSELPLTGQEIFGATAANVEPTARESVSIAKGTGGRPERVDWLWKDWLPRGMLTIFGGEKGVGKSTLTYHVLATVTRGGEWPDGSKCPIGDVLIWSAEDSWRVTILPRLMVAGADFEHVYRVENVKLRAGETRPFDPAIDMRGLSDAAAAIPNLAAVLIDPVVSAVAGDSHKNAETRRGLQPLVDFATARRAALIGITHFSKNTQGKSPLDRINGSLAFSAIARVVWGAVKSEDETAVRRLVRLSSNIGPMGGGFDYTFHQRQVPGEAPDFTAQSVKWGVYTEGDARSLIEEVQGGEERKSKLQEATEFLLKMVPRPPNMIEVEDVKKAASAHCIAPKTLRNAREKLKVITTQRSGAAPSTYCWQLPPRAEASGDVVY